jgi:hypothetical protein
VVWGGMKEQPIDRAMRAIRPAIIVFAVISAPVMLFTYAWGLKLLIPIVGLGWFLAICACHIICWLGIAGLVDMTQERRPSSEREQF